ncbi:MAG: hypothetical protein DCC43_08525 [Candidatus Brocadia sp.]|jgi:hypothetical protein|nr:hypothetical protein [Candidatus Brocadia sp. AMX3]OQY98046.1 MAG: hypothetical protein B6D35_13090 [Candidatus Brocadia sp. UTAMX2]RIJ99421.1 MAG: hypothetical protein DCC43_08525 [Candidatus Brocadia sp.]
MVIPLHGKETECSSADEAISFLSTYKSNGVQGKVYKYEINVLYNNGDRITAEFTTKEAVVEFLTRYR